jgi:hypothetical protein
MAPHASAVGTKTSWPCNSSRQIRGSSVVTPCSSPLLLAGVILQALFRIRLAQEGSTPAVGRIRPCVARAGRSACFCRQA